MWLHINLFRYSRYLIGNCKIRSNLAKLFTLREHRFHQIYCVIKRSRYTSTASRLMPCIFGKLDACKIHVLF